MEEPALMTGAVADMPKGRCGVRPWPLLMYAEDIWCKLATRAVQEVKLAFAKGGDVVSPPEPIRAANKMLAEPIFDDKWIQSWLL